MFPPILIPASTCYRKTTNRLLVRQAPTGAPVVFCDSGGYVFASRNYYYPFTRQCYLDWLEGMQPQYAAVLDYPCEPKITSTPQQIWDRQRRTLANAEYLMAHNAAWTWVPVVQGQAIDHYIQHAKAYRLLGMQMPYMGIGSLCSRRSATEIVKIVRSVAAELPGTQFHLFGVKLFFPPGKS